MISEFFIQLQIYLCGLYVFHDFTNIKIMTFAAQMLREVSKNSKHHHFCIQNWMKKIRAFLSNQKVFLGLVDVGAEKNDTTKYTIYG